MMIHRHSQPTFSLGASKPKSKSNDNSKVKSIAKDKPKFAGKPGTLEKEFLEGFSQGRVAVSVGTKNSGKSYLMLHYLNYCLENDIYDIYYLSLPTFNYEQKNSYKFIKEYKGKAKVIVYSQWDEMIINQIRQADPKLKKLCLVDDASGNFKLNATQEELLWISQIRHFNCSAWFIFHLLRNAMPSSFRCCTDYMFLHLNTNRKGIESVYEEYCSLIFPTFKEFLDYYKKEVLSEEYNSLLIMTREVGKIDPKVKSWLIQQKEI